MKNIENNWNVNSQEDEDGFSLNPYEVFIYDRTEEIQHYQSTKNAKISESGSAIHTKIASKEKIYIN